jgi:hypothetical protein
MSFNGSGVAVINSSGQPVVASTLITSADHNALTADIANMLSTCILKDGTQTITQNIPFNDKKITGLAAATARTDAASIATIQDGTGVYVSTVGGTANAITLTPSPAITAYATGQFFSFIAASTNTGSVTVAISGLTTKAITGGVTALTGGEIRTGTMVTMRYNGTAFELVGRGWNTTWTPVLSCGTPGNLSVSYTDQLGRYHIDGNKITAWFDVVTSSFTHTTASGSITITGMPFRSANVVGSTVSGALLWSGMTKANYTSVVPVTSSSSTTILFSASGSGQASATLAITDFPTGGTVRLIGCVVYLADGG